MEGNGQFHALAAHKNSFTFQPLVDRSWVWTLVDWRIKKTGNVLYLVRSKVLTVLFTKISVFWDTSSCVSMNVRRRFRGTCRLNLRSSRVSQTNNQQEVGRNQWHTAFVISQRAERFIFCILTYQLLLTKPTIQNGLTFPLPAGMGVSLRITF
jgi:hypothetical protein